MPYPEYQSPDYVGVGKTVRQFWQEHDIFRRSVSEREGAPTFTFYEGPPSANGAPGIHHVMSRTVKDVFCRYRTMKGFQVKRKGGWDTHGLPIELQVEKELGITKEDIGKTISVEEYNQRCREAVMKYKGAWDELTEQMGYWVDLDNPYLTFDPKYMETLWHLLKRLYDQGLLYKGYTIQPFSPAAGTGLSSHELNQPGAYRDVKDTSVVAQFKLTPPPSPPESPSLRGILGGGGDEEIYFLAWTTTPWTLPANAGLAVGEDIDYVQVNTFNAYTHQPVSVVLAEARLGAYFSPKAADIPLADYRPGDKRIPYEVVGRFKGRDLVGLRYEQLLPYVQPTEGDPFRVIPGDFVTTEDGTGIVHIAPTFGADDARAGQQHDIPPVMVTDASGQPAPLVNRQGRFVAEVTDFAGMPVKNYDNEDESDPNYRSTDVKIAIKLKEENKAFRVEKYEHSYPHCWRTDKPVLYYPLASWFVRTTARKEALVRHNETINWKPAATGTGRFGNWLENLVDWNLSRSRFWGTPLPIWRNEAGDAEICVGSYAELKAHVDRTLAEGSQLLSDAEREALEAFDPDTFDPHRPFVDALVLLSDDGQLLYREPDLIDVWFDSGAMPYAQWHYPFEGQEQVEQHFPADFIAEGVDQTRGWFFTLHALGVLLFDSVAFKNVIANGLVLDKDGNKMSKRLGNAIDPFETIDTYGPDATRWYLIANAPPWENLKFDLGGVQETQRKFFATLHNTYAFFALYANLDGFTYRPDEPVERTESDRWIISKLHSLVRVADEAYADYEPTRAARAIQQFTDRDLSNWYVRLNRKRFWRSDYPADKAAAYQTLFDCLATVARLMAPIAPFYAERLFGDLNGPTQRFDTPSVHLTDFPVADESLIDAELEARMALAQTASSLVHSIRKREKIKVRQPLSRVLVPVLSAAQRERFAAVAPIVLAEVNVKEIEYLDDASGVLVKRIKPNFRKLGKQYGKQMKALAAQINAFDQRDIQELEQEGEKTVQLNGKPVMLTRDDVEITSDDIPGWSVASEGGVTVALDLTITEALRHEGIARDLVNRVQNLRKDLGLAVQDKISLTVEQPDALVAQALEANREYICTETQARELDLVDKIEDPTLVEMDDFSLHVRVVRQ